MSTSAVSPPTADRIGFIGASSMMGHGMARHLLLKGFPLTLTQHTKREPSPVADLLAAGAVDVASAAAVAAASTVVFICVTGSAEVEQVLTKPDGLLAGAAAGSFFVDTSTSEPAVTARLRAACAARGVTLIDAPLARTPVEAEQGRLNVMVGASDADFARLLPLIKGVWAENVVHVGPPGAGHTVKLANNMMAMAITTSAAEAFGVCAKAGVDPKKLVEVVSLGGVNSGLFQGMAKALNGDLAGLKFQLDNARKDLRYYTHLGESVNVPTVVGDAVLSSLSIASALGHGAAFVPALVSAQETLASVKIVGGGGSA